MSVIQSIKTEPVYFDRIWKGEKTAEVRLNDREYQKGQILQLQEWESSHDKENDCLVSGGGYTGREIIARVTDIVPENTFKGLHHGYCLMSIKVLDRSINEYSFGVSS